MAQLQSVCIPSSPDITQPPAFLPCKKLGHWLAAQKRKGMLEKRLLFHSQPALLGSRRVPSGIRGWLPWTLADSEGNGD